MIVTLQQALEYPSLDIPPTIEILANPEWRTLWQLRNHLVERARKAAQTTARSYRGFNVGAAMLVVHENPEFFALLGHSPYKIYTGANVKLGPDERNTCAEPEALAQVRQQERFFPVGKIIAIAIAGEPQDEPDRSSGIRTPTLHPCNHCRMLLHSTPKMRPDTIIITVRLALHPDGSNTVEVQFFNALLERHTVNA